MEIAGRDDLDFACNAIFDRVTHPPKGRDGGGPGAPGRVELKTGATLRAKGLQVIPEGDRLVLSLPGGGGMGNPLDRDPVHVARDVRDGLVSVEAARRDYMVVVTSDGAMDAQATQSLREGGRSRR
jgi:N-methylhydantoinase B